MAYSGKYDTQSSSMGFAEYLVEKKITGKDILKKLLVILGGAAVVGAELALTLETIPPASFIFSALIIFFTWYFYQFTKVEYEYVVVQGEIELEVIYGKRKRKKLAQVKFSQIEKIAPYSTISKLAENIEISKTIYACSSIKDSDVYGVLYEDDNGKKCIVYINVVKKTIDSFKYYKRAALETNGEFDI